MAAQEDKVRNIYEEIEEMKDKIYRADLEQEPITEPAEFASKAMRSEVKLPYWRMPLRPIMEWGKRFAKGEKYDVMKGSTHNWKLGLNDIAFTRQIFDHALEHLFKAKEMAHKGAGFADHEGEHMMDHLGAAMWNVAALIEFLDKNPDLVCKALSQVPTQIDKQE